MNADILDLSIEAIVERIRSGAVEPDAAVRCSLERIRRSDDRLRSLISVADAWSGAGGSAVGPSASDSGTLAGIPFAAKDNIDIAGFVTTCGWPAWSDAPARRSAGLVDALQQAGAVAVGKANMPPLAFGATGRNEFYGTVLNPVDEAFTPGGSSSGSAASVAADLVAFALASDTTGSARTPAALCGVVGLRPEKARADRSGLTLRSPTLDSIGIMTRDTVDLARVWAAAAPDAAAGPEPPGSSPPPVRVVAPTPNSLSGRVDGETDRAFRHALAALSRAGLELTFVELPDLDAADEAARLISEFEPVIEYGHLLSSSREGGVGLPPSAHRRLMEARKIGRSEYERALGHMHTFNAELCEILAEPGSVLVTPATPKPRYAVDHEIPEARRERQTAFTRPLSLYSGAVAVTPRRAETPGVVPPALQVAAPSTWGLLQFFIDM